MECPQCGSPIKTVPAGVSKKTGKPYNAFQCCSNRECTWKPVTSRGTRAPSYGAPAQPSPQIGVAADMLNELKEIKVVLLAINAKLAKKSAPVEVDGPANPQDEVEDIDDQLEPDETVPF